MGYKGVLEKLDSFSFLNSQDGLPNPSSQAYFPALKRRAGKGNCGALPDFVKRMQIVIDSGYDGRIGIEYEESNISEDEGVKKTLSLIEISLAAMSI